MECLSVSESISNRWTTVKTETVIGGPSNSRELIKANTMAAKETVKNNTCGV